MLVTNSGFAMRASDLLKFKGTDLFITRCTFCPVMGQHTNKTCINNLLSHLNIAIPMTQDIKSESNRKGCSRIVAVCSSDNRGSLSNEVVRSIESLAID